MHSHRFALAAFVGFLLTATGCLHGNYRAVKTLPTAGELALEGPQEEARQKAEAYMASRCASGYDIVEEGEAVIGQNSTSQTQAGRSFLVVPTTNTTSSTTDKREWRIKYQCKGTAAPGGDAPAAVAAPKQGKIEEVIVVF